MVRDELSVMSAFLAVADESSFTKAAKRLGVTQSALSHAIRGLEEAGRCPTARADHAQRRANRGRRATARRITPRADGHSRRPGQNRRIA
jgi:DNA-binding MarR family transcriptional regulator